MHQAILQIPGRVWEPAYAGKLARGGRRLRLRIAAAWPWATRITAAITRLQAYAPG